MTDDELDRALFALPLEEPPADLRPRILAATILRPTAAFRAWELWVLGTVAAFAVWLTYLVLTSSPDAGHRIVDNFAVLLRTTGLVSLNTLFWLALGMSSAWLISSLTFMPRPRSVVYNK